MIIDVVQGQRPLMRYRSDAVPRVGDTITSLRPEKLMYKVTAVDHLINEKPMSDELRQQLVTVYVDAAEIERLREAQGEPVAPPAPSVPRHGKSEQEVIDQTNELAWEIYALRGYESPRGYRFDRATHPYEVEAWRVACVAQELLTGTDPVNALAESEENDQ